MRTIFTTEDMKNILDSAFNGNNATVEASNGAVEYENPNDEKIAEINAFTGETEEVYLARSLDIKFYAWKERVVEEERQGVFDKWVDSLDFSINKTYALVEFLSEDAVASGDIQSATDTGMATFLIQTNKIKLFDYYVRKVRNAFLGVPQTITNAFGDELTAFIKIGLPTYTEEPSQTQFGECLTCTVGFTVTYLQSAGSYADYKFELSLNGTDFSQIVLTQLTWQEIGTPQSVARANRPDIAGFVVTANSSVKSLAFFDFKTGIAKQLSKLFFERSAIKKNGVATERKSVNVPVWLRVTDDDGDIYEYKDVITQMEKVFKNTDFTVSSITLRGGGKQ